MVVLSGFTFDYKKVADRAGSLFSFLTGSVSLDAIASTAASVQAGQLANPLAAGRSDQAATPPPVLSGTEIQSLIDKSWSRRDRWNTF